MNAVLFRKGRIGLAVTLAAGLCASVGLAEAESPYATGGEVTKVDLGNCRVRYIHVFTNTDEVATFKSTGLKDLSLRYLVVGAGGSGGYGSHSTGGGSSNSCGGGGGGGGGVCEVKDVLFPVASEWSVLVGKGATSAVSPTNPGTAAGMSSISNATDRIAEVPGGGNGARGAISLAKGVQATDGAAGGGAVTYVNVDMKGGKGTYESSIFGVIPEGAPFDGGDVGTSTYCGTGGGGASEKGGKSGTKAGDGGEGLASDITGELLVYGSGGGGGAHLAREKTGGLGGTRAGNGATYEITDGGATKNFFAATMPAENSGCGGAGGMQDGNCNAGTDGADGIVVIRYEVTESPCEGGDVVTRTHVRGTRYTYIHIFTNTTAAAEFRNLTGRELKLRYLVVGGGGSGGYGSTNKGGGQYSCGGGGGGGGGVCEVKGVPFAGDAVWSILVGNGAESVVSQADPGTTAGTSSISNATDKIAEVPGGGNGARGGNGKSVNATSGAAGGGTTKYAEDPGVGTYESSIFGEVPKGAPFAGGAKPDGYCGSGGGGACANGTSGSTTKAGDGGEGLSSDITGELLVYGSGGGGGAHLNRGRIGGLGGARAGNGATYEIADGGATTNFFAATMPAANSGCGGAGGMQDGNCDASTAGADGIVVFRYDYDPTPPGLMLLFK